MLFYFHGSKPNPVYDILAEALIKRGHTVIIGASDDQENIVWYSPNGETFGKIQLEPLRPKRITTPFFSWFLARYSMFKMMREVRKYILSFNPDILQINTNVNPWVLAINLPKGIHSTYDIRQINESVNQRFRTRIQEKLQLFRYRFFTRYIFEHSFFCHKEAARHIVGEDWQQFSSVIPVAVDDHFNEYDSNQLRSIGDGEPLKFVYVGTLCPLRNLQKLFYAADILRNQREHFRITLVGPDQSNGYYQQIIDQVNVNDFVTIEPSLPYNDIPAYLANQHIGLAYVPDRPTWHYQPTIKILEYRALGLPILSTDVASHREFIQDGVNGVMVQDSPESIAAGMRRFLDDREFLKHTISNARRMRKGMTWDQVAEAYEGVYQQLLAKDGDRS